jgi:hypothetical protein
MVQMCTSNDTMNAVATQGFRLATENGGDASWDAAWELLNSVTGFWPLTLRWKEMLKLKKKKIRANHEMSSKLFFNLYFKI